MSDEKYKRIEEAWRKNRAATDRLKRIAEDIYNAAVAKAGQDRFGQLDKAYKDALRDLDEAEKEVDQAHRDLGLNI